MAFSMDVQVAIFCLGIEKECWIYKASGIVW
jgi:hypothetical protein